METISIREQWEGRVAAGKFPLLEFLGGNAECGVFLTVLEGAQKAAIKLIPADDRDGDTRLAVWQKASALSHPALMTIFDAGRCASDGNNFLYVVTERAETDLAQILPNKALDNDEAAKIFHPVIEALVYLHRNEIIHGHMKPSNILLVGGVAKLSSDDFLVTGEITRRARQPGSHDAPEMLNARLTAAADTWSLGMTLAEAITRKLPVWDWSGSGEPQVPGSLPQPYLDVVRACLRLNPAQRCTLRSILDLLEAYKPAVMGSVSPAETKPRAASVGATTSLAAQPAPAVEPAQSGPGPDPVPIKEAPVAPEPPAAKPAAAWEQRLNGAAVKAALPPGDRVGARSPEKPASRWDFEPDPLPRVFTYLEESEPEPRRFPTFRLILGLLILIAVGGVLIVGIPKDEVASVLAHLNLRSPDQTVPSSPTPTQPTAQAGQPTPPAQSPSAPTESPVQPQTVEPQASGVPGSNHTPGTPSAQAGSQQAPPPQSNAAASTAPASPAQPGAISGAPPSASQTGSQSASAAGSQPAPPAGTAPAPGSSTAKIAPRIQTPASPPPANAEGTVANRVMPSVSNAAREGMERPITVTLRVLVNRDGGVSGVAYLTSGPGNYFARSAYRAAQAWKFSPPMRRGQPQASVWTLHFYFSRGATDVEATPEAR